KLLVRQRTPYGLVRVTERIEPVRNADREFGDPKPIKQYTQRQLMHATTHHGSAIIEPPELRRYPTTYYHEFGPVGRVMRSSAWFTPTKVGQADWRQQHREQLSSDARIAASLVAMGAVPLGTAPLPMETLTTLWSEPPYAIVGMGAGILYGYAHPYQ